MVKCIFKLTKYVLFQYIGNILQTGNLGYNNYRISDFYSVIASRYNYLAVAEYSCYEHVFLEAEVGDRHTDNRGGLSDDKLGCLYLAFDYVVECLHITASGVLCASYVSDDHIRYDGLGVDYGVEIESVDHAVIVHARYLSHDLALCLFLRVEGEDHILLIGVGER